MADWSRSSFFNPDTETQTHVVATPDPESEDDDVEFPIEEAEANRSRTASRQSQSSKKAPLTDNPIMDELIEIMVARFEHLVDSGFLNPQFLGKIKNDPQEMLNFIRKNREVVGDQLNRRLNPKIRPTPQQLVQKGIVPKGYFTHGHEKAMTRKHRRKSTAQQDLAAFIQLRPKPEQMEAKGILSKNEERKEEEELIGSSDPMGDKRDRETWEISILGTLLFKTISEALSASCLETQRQEEEVLLQMEEMNTEMKHLRDALDKYFLDDEPDVLLFAAEESMIRDKFHAIQKKLLNISTKQNAIHEKLRILHSVESAMIDLQNIYDKELGQLRKTECDVLRDLKEQRTRREKAIKIRIAEKSRCNWAMAKLDYTKSIAARHQNQKSSAFIESLNGFLSSLQQISENQNNIVRDFDFAIDELESHLLSIRHDMSKVRTMTFKKIYDLHKQVEIAESLELGNRRLSVASATEIERERRHFGTKITRQLSTLSAQIEIFNIEKYQNNLREIIDIQLVMSHNKLKAFFSVFTSSFTQTICDINICYQNLNCLMEEKEKAESDGDGDSDSDAYNNNYESENKGKIKKLCMELYGIHNVLAPIQLEGAFANLGIVEKIIHCMKFIQIAKNALRYEMYKTYMNSNNNNSKEEMDPKPQQFVVDTNKINGIIIIIARKLAIDDHTIDDIDRSNEDQLSNLAQVRVKAVFEKIIKCQDFNQFFGGRKPLNAMDVATVILNKVFGIKNNEQNGQYLN